VVCLGGQDTPGGLGGLAGLGDLRGQGDLGGLSLLAARVVQVRGQSGLGGARRQPLEFPAKPT
jgi:hypothetical protein